MKIQAIVVACVIASSLEKGVAAASPDNDEKLLEFFEVDEDHYTNTQEKDEIDEYWGALFGNPNEVAEDLYKEDTKFWNSELGGHGRELSGHSRRELSGRRASELGQGQRMLSRMLNEPLEDATEDFDEIVWKLNVVPTKKANKPATIRKRLLKNPLH